MDIDLIPRLQGSVFSLAYTQEFGLSAPLATRSWEEKEAPNETGKVAETSAQFREQTLGV